MRQRQPQRSKQRQPQRSKQFRKPPQLKSKRPKNSIAVAQDAAHNASALPDHAFMALLCPKQLKRYQPEKKICRTDAKQNVALPQNKISLCRKRKSRLAEIGGITNYHSTAVAPALSSNLAHSAVPCAGTDMESFRNGTYPNHQDSRVHEHTSSERAN